VQGELGHLAPWPDRPLPPYLQEENFAAIRERVGRIEVRHANLTEHLAMQPKASLDR
jgi:S-adenosylmethionine-diacylglycerol 3-amino-3-carboxypropyl transferase